MEFGHYIKACRKRFRLTQDELVEHLYRYDELFIKLDVVTLSRWERCITCPNLKRQKKLIEALRSFTTNLFPAFDVLNISTIKTKLNPPNITKIIGKHPRYILEFPVDLIESNKIVIVNMKEDTYFEKSLQLTYELHKKITKNYSNLSLENFIFWTSHPKSLFLLANYENHFFGMLFSLSLKKEPFEKLLQGEIKENEITLKDFAETDDKHYQYLIGFFAYSQKSASLLMLTYYQYLIDNQQEIEEIGSLVKIEEGHKLVQLLGLQANSKSKETPLAYRGHIKDVLLNKIMLTKLFQKNTSK